MATQKHNHHEEAAKNYDSAAKSHRAAHEAHQQGNDEKAASYAQAGRGHSSKANKEAGAASRKHADNSSSTPR